MNDGGDISKPPTLRSESCPIAFGETDSKLVDMLAYVHAALPNTTQFLLAFTCSLGSSSSEILSLWRGLSCVITADFQLQLALTLSCTSKPKRKAQQPSQRTHNHNITCLLLPCSRSIMEAENNRRNPYIFTSEDRQGVPRDVTHVIIDGSVKVILDSEETFLGHPTLLDVVCRDGVVKVAQAGFLDCPSLTRVKMPSVEGIGRSAFKDCPCLMYIECGKLEFIEVGAFGHCKSLRSINLPSAKTVEMCAFSNCQALANVKFGKELESIGFRAFNGCTSLERITIPLKDGMVSSVAFSGCENLERVDLIEGALHETIAYLQLEEWRNDMNATIDLINEILPNTPDGANESWGGGKGTVIQRWIRSVLRKIIQYKAQHQRLLNEAAATLQHVLPQDIVIKNVLPFLELPSYTFEVGDHEGLENDSEEEEEEEEEDDVDDLESDDSLESDGDNRCTIQ
eukprot:scaffold2262_cov107-Skeletonema_dohrnii-CCMP3373.AAC.8